MERFMKNSHFTQIAHFSRKEKKRIILNKKDLALEKQMTKLLKTGFLLPQFQEREIQIQSSVSICCVTNTTGGRNAHMFVFLIVLFMTIILPSFFSLSQSMRGTRFCFSISEFQRQYYSCKYLVFSLAILKQCHNLNSSTQEF